MSAEWVDFDDLTDVVAREFLRVSFDKSGRIRSNDEQHGDNLKPIERFGWALGEPYGDVGSASKFARKKERETFSRLLADVESGSFGAQVLVMWEASRSSRRVSEWAKLLEALEDAGVRVYVTTLRRLFDPANDRDWEDLLREAIDAEKESRKTSRRVRRAANADAASGSFRGGRRPFGFEFVDGELVHHPVESEYFVEAVERILDSNHSIREIAADFNERGILTTAGNPWAPNVLSKALVAPRNAGRRIHHGRDVGAGTWEPLLDEITYKRLVAVLNSRSPVGRRGRTPYLLTGLLVCSLCGAPLVAQRSSQSQAGRTGVRRYACRKGPGHRGCGRLTIKAEDVEREILEAATDRLADLAALRSSIREDDDAPDLAALGGLDLERKRLASKIREWSDELIADYDADITRRKAEIEARIAARARRTAPLDLVAGLDGRSIFDYEPSEQRGVLDGLLRKIVVAPASVRGSTRFEPERLDPDWIEPVDSDLDAVTPAV